MTNPKGTYAETAAAKWLTDELGTPFTRLPRYGKNDQGDIAGWPQTVIEVKNTKACSLFEWGRELRAEIRNAGCSDGVVLWSPPGIGNKRVDRWIVFEWGFTDLPSAVPLVVPLNRLHRQVEACQGWGRGRPVAILVGSSWVSARWASAWVYDLREQMPATAN